MDIQRKKLLYFLFCFNLIVLLRAEISNVRLCANPACNEPISYASSLIRYVGNDKYSLQFPANSKIVVYSKSAGSVPHLWGGMFNGKRGYFPKDFVREYKILISKLEFEVPTEQTLEAADLNTNDVVKLPEGAAPSKSQDNLASHPSHADDDKVLNENNSDKELKTDQENVLQSADVENKSPHFKESEDLRLVKSSDDSATPKQPTNSESRSDPSPNVPDDAGAVSPVGETTVNIEKVQPSLSSDDYAQTSAFNQYPTSSINTPEIHTSEVGSLTNTAVWFPESGEKSKIGSESVSSDSDRTVVDTSQNYVVLDGTQILIDEGDSSNLEVTTTRPFDYSSASLSVETANIYVSSLVSGTLSSHIPGSVSSTSQNEPHIDVSRTLSVDGSRMPETSVNEHDSFKSADNIVHHEESDASEITYNEENVDAAFKTRTLKSDDLVNVGNNEKEHTAEKVEAGEVDLTNDGGWFKDITDFLTLNDVAEDLKSENLAKSPDASKATGIPQVEGEPQGIQHVEGKKEVNEDIEVSNENVKRNHDDPEPPITSVDPLNTNENLLSDKNDLKGEVHSSANDEKNDDEINENVNVGSGTEINDEFSRDDEIPTKDTKSDDEDATDEQSVDVEKSYFDNATNEEVHGSDDEQNDENANENSKLLESDRENDKKIVDDVEKNHQMDFTADSVEVHHHHHPENLTDKMKDNSELKDQYSSSEPNINLASGKHQEAEITEDIWNNRGNGVEEDESAQEIISEKHSSQDAPGLDMETPETVLNEEKLDDQNNVDSIQETTDSLTSPSTNKQEVAEVQMFQNEFIDEVTPSSIDVGVSSSIDNNESHEPQPPYSESDLNITSDEPSEDVSSHYLQQMNDDQSSSEMGSCEAKGFEGSCSDFTKEAGVHDSDSLDEYDGDEHNENLKDSSFVFALRTYLQAVLNFFPEALQASFQDLQEMAVSPRVVVLLVIIGSFMVLLDTVHLFIKKNYNQSLLLAKIGSLDLQLLKSTTEIDELKSQLEKVSSENWEGIYHEAQLTIEVLEAELKATQSENGRLQEATTKIQQHLNDQRSDISNLKLNSEALLQEKELLMKEVSEIRESYNVLKQECDKLKTEVEELTISKDATQQECAEKDKRIVELEENNVVLISESEARNTSIAELKDKISSGEKEIEALKESLALKVKEIEVLSECISEFKIASEKVDDGETSGLSTEIIIQKLTDIAKMKEELKNVTEERDFLQRSLESEKFTVMSVEEEAETLRRNVERLQIDFDISNKERVEAQKKLEVLSNYFKEKELQLQKELGVHEALRRQSHNSVISVTQKISMYEQETSLYKSQIEGLKSEIDDQERSYKTQVALQEKKAHENWLAARAAERKLEETKQEASALRNKLTILEQERANTTLNKTDLMNSQQMITNINGDVSSPRLGAEDRSESMDLPMGLPLDPPPLGPPIFLPADHPMPFMPGMPPGPLLPPPPLLLPLPLPPHIDMIRGPFPFPPSGPPPQPMSPDNWISPIRRASPPNYMDRPPSPSSSQRRPSSASFEQHPLPNRNPEANPQDIVFEGDGRGMMSSTRFHAPPPPPPPVSPPHGILPVPLRGPFGPRPFVKRVVYPSGRPGSSIDPRMSSPVSWRQFNDDMSQM